MGRGWPILKWIHLIVGAAGLAAFLATGQYMDRRLDHLVGMPDGPRALYRSAHIYILFSSLTHLVLGTYLSRARARLGRAAQYLGSALLLAALGLFLYGFFAETPLALVERPMVRRGIYWSLWGVLLHATSGVFERRVVTMPGRREAGAEPASRLVERGP